jgi:ribonucleoside-diphosphate reductase alpha chain
MSQSIMDYIFRRLALDYLPFEKRAALGIYTADERRRQLETGSYEAPVEEVDQGSVEVEDRVDPRTLPTAPIPSGVAVGPDLDAVVKAAPGSVHTSAELMEVITGTAVDSPLCFTCGTKMRPAGSCYVCEGCGSTSGCS